MRNIIEPVPRRRATTGIHQIRSPLSRIAFTLPQNASHLLWLRHGAARLGSDAATEQFPGPCLLWCAGGTRRDLTAEVGTRGTLISIPEPVLIQALPVTPAGDQMQQMLSRDFDIPGDAKAATAEALEGLIREHSGTEPGAESAAGSYLALILLNLWRGARREIAPFSGAPQPLSERFALLAAQRLRDHRPVEEYARDLHVSRNRLGAAVKRATGLSPRAYLHRLLLRDAMELLINSGMPVSQVAFRLGYADPAYFTRFFKRETGQNPGAFRRARRRKAGGEIPSFAAWP